MNTRRIYINKLSSGGGIDAHQSMAGGLWFMRGDTELLANKPIKQSRLTHIGATGDGDVSALFSQVIPC